MEYPINHLMIRGFRAIKSPNHPIILRVSFYDFDNHFTEQIVRWFVYCKSRCISSHFIYMHIYLYIYLYLQRKRKRKLSDPIYMYVIWERVNNSIICVRVCCRSRRISSKRILGWKRRKLLCGRTRGPGETICIHI